MEYPVNDFFTRTSLGYNIEIAIQPDAYRKMKYYIEAATGEVSGLLFVKQDNDNKYTVMDTVILKQECSGGYTNLDKRAMLEFIVKCHKRKIDTRSVLRGWWHSHCNFGVFWSGTDEATATRFGFGGKDAPDWWVSIVANKSGDILGRVDTYAPKHQCLNDNITPHIAIDDDERMRRKCTKQVKELVSEIKFKPYKHKKTKREIDLLTNDYERKVISKNDTRTSDVPEFYRKYRTGLNEYTIGGYTFEWTGQGLYATGRAISTLKRQNERNSYRRGVGGVIYYPLLSQDGF